MRLYFMRHADAVDGADDALRPLSELGVEQARNMGRFLANAGVQFDAAYTSPLLRARQTAELVLPVTNDDGKLKLLVANALLNETSQSAFTAWLRKIPEAGHVLLVGHVPSLVDRVSRLLSDSIPGAFKLPKGTVVCLETEDRRRAVLKLFISPKFLGA